MDSSTEGAVTPRQADEGWCCLDDCCAPGSWCCAHANPHDHTENGEVVPLGDASRQEGASSDG